jgi:endonuclease/exonuclease/phosphatase family metal-dependent hydrolase
MLLKIFSTLAPLVSGLAPVCSQSLPADATVFAALMNENPRPSMPPSAHSFETLPEPIQIDETIRTMSFNICCDDHHDHDWSARKRKVSSVIRFHRADLIGLQEPSSDQIGDLTEFLPEFNLFAGVCLADGEVNTHDAILFRSSRFELIDSGFFFLSPTPERLSKGWEAKFPRGASWVKLLDRKTEKAFYFFNTHFDYHSRLARDESAQLLRSKVSEIAGSEPFIVVGDFNLFPDLGGGETYKRLTESGVSFEGRPFQDAQKASLFPHHGPTGTWSGFKEAGQPGIKPDYIFVDASVKVYLHGVLADSFDGQFPSDHLPVVADVAIR